MTALTAEQKQAGRHFKAERQAALDNLNAAQPPGVTVLPLWRVVRHQCRRAGDASVGIVLREVTELSPEYRACYCGAVGPSERYFPHDDCDGSKVAAAAGQFAWIWKEGRCSGCGLAARTAVGRFLVVADREADHGRPSVERQAGTHPGDT